MATTLRPDICVIGGGSGGLTVAAAAASFGVDVEQKEKGKMGGDCLNYGCVPSKAMIAAGKHAHAIAEAANGEPVVLSHALEPTDREWDVLINMADDVPEFFSRYHRVAEVVDKETGRRDAGRERFRFYRERGYELHTHNV